MKTLFILLSFGFAVVANAVTEAEQLDCMNRAKGLEARMILERSKLIQLSSNLQSAIAHATPQVAFDMGNSYHWRAEQHVRQMTLDNINIQALFDADKCQGLFTAEQLASPKNLLGDGQKIANGIQARLPNIFRKYERTVQEADEQNDRNRARAVDGFFQMRSRFTPIN